MSHLLHVFPLISLHEVTPITDAYQWDAHDHVLAILTAYMDTRLNTAKNLNVIFIEK